MANRSRAKGDRFEYQVRDDLTERGYWVRRAAASRFPDMVAVCKDEVLWVECKTNGRLDPGEWNELYDLAMKYGGTPILASKPVRGGLAYHRLLDRKVPGVRTLWAPLEAWAT